MKKMISLGVTMLLFSHTANADLTFEFSEKDADVICTVSGSLDITAPGMYLSNRSTATSGTSMAYPIFVFMNSEVTHQVSSRLEEGILDNLPSIPPPLSSDLNRGTLLPIQKIEYFWNQIM